jgi:hypothetical protein
VAWNFENTIMNDVREGGKKKDMLHALDAFRGKNWVLHRNHLDLARGSLPI